jgi:TorA maturation chaperone TorD
MPADDANRFAARADLCRFLAGCYYQPGAEFVEDRLFDSMHDVAAQIDAELAAGARRLHEAFVAENLEDLLVDYTRLFLGPIDILAKPYGSVWLDDGRTLMQDSTMAVMQRYAEGGFEMDEAFRELPDHVAAELEFLYLLLFRQAQARRADDMQALDEAASLQRLFLGEHLSRWIGPFTAAMRAGARSEFYRRLATLTERVVRREAGDVVD